MSRAREALASFVAVHVAVYLYSSFIADTLDYQAWAGPGRAVAVFAAVLLGCVGVAVAYGRPR